ncbi:MAG: hypothetical protein J5662_05045, partial [Clostridia bacterium]|nr:hypothetical protein [Clostridia bacterium]
MNNSSVEKLLQEKAELLPKANFNLTSEITYQTAFSIQKDKKTVVRPVLRIAFATLAIVIFTFSVCFVASADFRNKVIYVFRANRQEIIPKISSGNSAIKLVGKRNIEDVADVFYYNIGGNSVKDSIITISKFDESKKYYSME